MYILYLLYCTLGSHHSSHVEYRLATKIKFPWVWGRPQNPYLWKSHNTKHLTKSELQSGNIFKYYTFFKTGYVKGMYFLFFRYVKDMFKNKFVYWVCISFKKVCNSESRAYIGGKVPNLPEIFWKYTWRGAHTSHFHDA